MNTGIIHGEGSGVERTVLPSGIRVVTERMPSLASETIGIWVDSGSRDETDLTAGSTHFLEHMLFKGTTKRTAKDIAIELERTGGDSNAATAKEYTCYYSRCLVDDLPAVTGLLWDMVLDSTLEESEFERERGVIIEELAMSADDPTDVLFEAFDTLTYADQPLGRPVGATKDQISGLEHSVLTDHYAHAYVGPRLVFAAAGGAEHEQIVEYVRAATAHLPTAPAGSDGAAASAGGATSAAGTAVRAPALYTPGNLEIVRETEQQQIVLGVEGLAEGSDEKYVFSVLYALLGGSMASRLFQTVREERGLAYSVQTFSSRYSDTGQFGIYAGCSPESAQQVIDLCLLECEKIASEAPSAEEMTDTISQTAGSTVLGLESSATRMNRLARAELTGLPLDSPEEILRRVREVRADQVRDLAARLFDARWSLATIGPRTGLVLPS